MRGFDVNSVTGYQLQVPEGAEGPRGGVAVSWKSTRVRFLLVGRGWTSSRRGCEKERRKGMKLEYGVGARK
jgi:hypothetical protein